MALIQFDPLQQTIELLLSKGWTQNKGQEDDRFKKGDKDIIITMDHTKPESLVIIKMHYKGVFLAEVDHRTADPLPKYFIES